MHSHGGDEPSRDVPERVVRHRHRPTQVGLNPLQVLRGDVFCRDCGVPGRYSNGNRKAGRSRKVFWSPALREAARIAQATGGEHDA